MGVGGGGVCLLVLVFNIFSIVRKIEKSFLKESFLMGIVKIGGVFPF